MAKGHFRVGHAGALHTSIPSKNSKRASSSCATGGFYKSPSSGQSISSKDTLDITWDTSCLNVTKDAVDIYLYAPGLDSSRIHEWEAVPYSQGSYSTVLKPKWWNDTTSVNLQLLIINSGDAPFMATLPAGPIWTATYDPSNYTGSSSDTDTDTTDTITNAAESKHGLSKGATAAAVLLPLLFIIGLIVAGYIKVKRSRGKDKRKRWSEAVDKRMSTISTDWKSMTPSGASAAIRNSMAFSQQGANSRASTFSFGGGMREASFDTRGSTYAVEGGQAGVGARGIFVRDESNPEMSQLRYPNGVNPLAERVSRVSFADGTRVSRVSFADGTRPSIDSRRSRVTSRAFHTGYVPPLPTRQDSSSASSDNELPSGMLSPTQAQGPFTLTPEDIRARMSGANTQPRPSIDEVMPALTMMRTGMDASEMLYSPDANDAYVETWHMPTPPTPSHQPESPIPSATAPLMQMPTPSVDSPSFPMVSPVMPSMQLEQEESMSPDALLRAYATKKAQGETNQYGMRVLYSPPGSPAPAANNQSFAAFGADSARQ
ncbi:hypothetical protein PUNSTDRAFT_53946 [Punctularia strigosozonata HHB-11173 SS5]|uniref:uncharacterized protein n=1 Tax=Punctularia strigosozonata (strain HHB-11173) TaxID=741275 RepID=UPI0004418134|nr:uncharacterized protein PUNSTDRAFT_53946 [Punctularia strigosozonata HHB-11173 SS5]EIN06503.1 hypothetical protein PUNSTDRAFT_53946 [Punctularia strigosozonata HHB-11173 SS5]